MNENKSNIPQELRDAIEQTKNDDEKKKMGFPDDHFSKCKNTKYCKQFNFLIEPTDEPRIAQFVKNAEIDFVKNTLEIQLYDVVETQHTVSKWLNNQLSNNGNGEFTIYYLGDNGVVLRKCKVSNFTIESVSTKFDYSNSDVSCFNVKGTFVNIEGTFKNMIVNIDKQTI